MVDISIDEQTIGYQGRHTDILSINYKKEGGVFQCDTIYSDGYTHSVYFQNQAPPKTFLDMKMSPLHSMLHVILEQIPLAD